MCGSNLYSHDVVKRHNICIQALDKYKSNTLREAIIAKADADFWCALFECVYNNLKANVPLNDAQRQRLRKYRKQLRKLSRRRSTAARRSILQQQQVGEGQSGGFLSALLAPFASSVFFPLLREGPLK